MANRSKLLFFKAFKMGCDDTYCLSYEVETSHLGRPERRGREFKGNFREIANFFLANFPSTCRGKLEDFARRHNCIFSYLLLEEIKKRV